MRRLQIVLAVLLTDVLTLTGCTVGPDFHQPDAPKVNGYTATPLTTDTTQTPVALGHGQHFSNVLTVNEAWWTSFGSNKLNSLIDQALQASPTIEAAQATLEQAKQSLTAHRGSTLYPQVGLNFGAERQLFNPAAFGFPGNATAFNLYNANVGVSYLFDLFGGNRRSLEAFAAQADYQQHELRAARLTLAGNLAIAAMTQAALDAQMDATQRIVAIQREQLAIARQRLALGAITLSDVLALQTQMEQTRASLPPLMYKTQKIHHLIATLCGKTPGDFTPIVFKLTDFSLPEQLPVVIPSSLVRQRPDIQAAEALLHVANAQYGNAIASTYPQINLTGALGQESLTMGSLFNPASTVWSLAGQLSQPLFNAGLKAGVKMADANLQIANADYRQTVLQAFLNVADTLRALDNDAQVLDAQNSADHAAQQALDLTAQQFRLGGVTYLQWLTAQQQAQQTRINVIAAQAQRLTDTAALYQAMGGAQAGAPNTPVQAPAIPPAQAHENTDQARNHSILEVSV